MAKSRDYSEYVSYSHYGYMKRTYGPLWWLPPENAAVNHQPVEEDIIVVRAMDCREFAKLVVGKTLKNKVVWQKRGLRSTSIGFCFFKEGSDREDQFVDENHRIFVYLRFRKGTLIRSFGFYGDPEPEEEYCTTKYSLADCAVIAAYDTHCVDKCCSRDGEEFPESWERLL